MISSPTVPLLVPQLDGHGSVTELLRDEDLPLFGGYSLDGKTSPQPKFGQLTLHHVDRAGTIRSFSRHQHCWDFFIVLEGKFCFWCVSPEVGTTKEFVLAGKVYSRLCVPPMWYYGWQSLTPDAACLCAYSHAYNPDEPDEEKVHYSHFDYLGVHWPLKSQ